MRESRVKVVNQLGLHARAAAQLVRLASEFKCRITINRTESFVCADAKSILSVLNLAAARGTELGVIFDGEDELEAQAAIVQLFGGGFGEA